MREYYSISKLIHTDFMVIYEINLAVNLGKILDKLHIFYYFISSLASSFQGDRIKTEYADIAVILWL